MWRFAAARATGSSHLRSGLPCQDQLACLALDGGTLVAVLADGAGSAAMAEEGAWIVVEAIVHHVSDAIQEGRTDFPAVLAESATEARDRVLAFAEQQDTVAEVLASTVLAAVVGADGGAALQIGDGVIVVSRDGEEWGWEFWPQHGEYVNTTRFLTDDDALQFLQVAPFDVRVSDIALMSDGLEPLALHYASRSVHAPFFDGMFSPLLRSQGEGEIASLSAALEEFLASERVADRAGDDVSLIMATRRLTTSGQ